MLIFKMENIGKKLSTEINNVNTILITSLLYFIVKTIVILLIINYMIPKLDYFGNNSNIKEHILEKNGTIWTNLIFSSPHLFISSSPHRLIASSPNFVSLPSE